jgi:hypothetical protein
MPSFKCVSSLSVNRADAPDKPAPSDDVPEEGYVILTNAPPPVSWGSALKLQPAAVPAPIPVPRQPEPAPPLPVVTRRSIERLRIRWRGISKSHATSASKDAPPKAKPTVVQDASEGRRHFMMPKERYYVSSALPLSAPTSAADTETTTTARQPASPEPFQVGQKDSRMVLQAFILSLPPTTTPSDLPPSSPLTTTPSLSSKHLLNLLGAILPSQHEAIACYLVQNHAKPSSYIPLLNLAIKHRAASPFQATLDLCVLTRSAIPLPTLAGLLLDTALLSPTDFFDALIEHSLTFYDAAAAGKLTSKTVKAIGEGEVGFDVLQRALELGGLIDIDRCDANVIIAIVDSFDAATAAFREERRRRMIKPQDTRTTAYVDSLESKEDMHWLACWTKCFKRAINESSLPLLDAVIARVGYLPRVPLRQRNAAKPSPQNSRTVNVTASDGVTLPIPVQPYPKLVAAESFSIAQGRSENSGVALDIDSYTLRSLLRFSKTGVVAESNGGRLIELVYLGDEYGNAGLTSAACYKINESLESLVCEDLLDVCCMESFGVADSTDAYDVARNVAINACLTVVAKFNEVIDSVGSDVKGDVLTAVLETLRDYDREDRSKQLREDVLSEAKEKC